MAKIAGPHTLPDDHAALIGRVAEVWSQLEFQIDQGIWHLASTEQQLTACMTSQFLSIHPRLHAFTALVKLRNGSQKSLKSLSAFSGGISGLGEKRNRAVHDPRFRGGDSKIYRLEITAKSKKVEFGFIPESKESLQKTIDQIYKKVHEFIKLRDRALNEIDKLPPGSQPTLLQISPVNMGPSTPASDPQES